MKKIYFVRHGETDANESDTEQNREGVLTDLGKRQTENLGKRFLNIPIDVIISSSYPRARDTSKIINQNINKGIVYSDLFIEYLVPSVIVGKVISNQSTIDVYRQLAKNYHTGDRHSDEETFKDLKNRANHALQFIADRNEENILVVTHGMFLRTILAYILLGENLTSQEFEAILSVAKTKNTGLTFVEYNDSTKSLAKWKLIVWNDHSHLG